MRKFGTVGRKRCPYCKKTRPTYLLASHMLQCARDMNERQAARQRELLAELERVQAS